tara:strand:- start:53 stop:310 length:258 start_codon:yes stop_codon:yes gene_type:complete
MLSAAFAECSQALIRNPSEVIKQQLQIGSHDNMSTAIKEVFKHQGIKGFYTGYLSLIMREIPFSSIQMPFYEMLKLTAIKFTAKK